MNNSTYNLFSYCYFSIQWLPLENIESGQINLRCTWFSLTEKPEDLSPVSEHLIVVHCSC